LCIDFLEISLYSGDDNPCLRFDCWYVSYMYWVQVAEELLLADWAALAAENSHWSERCNK
jgi:hypothetical protein